MMDAGAEQNSEGGTEVTSFYTRPSQRLARHKNSQYSKRLCSERNVARSKNDVMETGAQQAHQDLKLPSGFATGCANLDRQTRRPLSLDARKADSESARG